MPDDTRNTLKTLRREMEELSRTNAELKNIIGENRRTIDSLRESERTYRRLAENMPDIIAWFDRDLRHRYVNPAIERITGIRHGEYIGKTNEELGMNPEQVEFWNERLHEVFRTGAGRAIEFNFSTPGGIQHFQSLLTPVFGDDGAVESVISAARDMTGFRHTEADLKEHRDSLAEVQEVSRLGSSRYDFRTGKMTWSGTLYRILGVSPCTEPDMELFRSLIHPDDLEWLTDLQQSTRNVEGDARYEIEYRIITPAGETRHLAVVSHFLRDKTGAPLKVTSVMQDITERKRVEEIQRADEERLRQVVTNMPVLLDAFDRDGLVIAWNRESERVTGYSAAEVIGNPKFLELFYPDPECRAAVQEALGLLDAGYREWTLTCKDGSKRTVAWSNIGTQSPIPGWSHWAIGVDVTERHLVEEERERLIRELRQSLAEVKTLRGLIPICSHCKKIRDDSGYWQQIEKYIGEHSDASFSHGICPDCMREYYPGLSEEDEK